MGDDSGRQVFGPLIEQAKTGAVSLKVNPQAFVALDQAMEKRKTEIRAIQQLVQQVNQHESWGLGEKSAVLTSAHTLVQRFRDKGSGGGSSAHEALEGHWQVADEVQSLFRTIRERLQQTDSEFAAQYRAISTAPGPAAPGPSAESV
ncbi:hypothetical protein BJY24_005929 [Nocardia transvalensis]|uniref:PE family protein n=1 Tax=Nocardia transvalensis TaxID=37333 RepID=A0A7W9PIX5_9NOCA|nr:hypothetical protein [Nocardia transvalensis]MBB5917017.1 hypothetical protein [Nocardia transvalensis]